MMTIQTERPVIRTRVKPGSGQVPAACTALMSAGVRAAMAWLAGSRPGRAVTIRAMASSRPALSRANAAGALTA
jgi:hypothetical protein